MGDIYKAVGKRIAEARRNLGWTQEELAERAELTASYLARIEAGKRHATLSTLATLAEAMEVPLSAIVDPGNRLRGASRRGPHDELAEATQGLSPSDLRLLTQVARRFRSSRAKR